jgi:hypothetical protein
MISLDWVMVALLAAAFAVAVGYVRACAHLTEAEASPRSTALRPGRAGFRLQSSPRSSRRL